MVCIVRLSLPSAWTAEEDARLERLAKENGFRHWHRVARQMLGRSHGLCRDRWRHHLARHVYHRGRRRRARAPPSPLRRPLEGHQPRRRVYGRTTGVLKKRWKEIGKNPANKTSFCCPPALPDDDDEDLEMEPEPEPEPYSPPLQHPQADILAEGLSSCSLVGCGTVDPTSQGRQPRVRVRVHGSI